MKPFFRIVVALGAALLLAAQAGAQAWPAKPIRFVVPYPPGGGTDIVARLVAAKMSESLGKPVVVENKPGATTIIGTEIVARSPADGYTIGLITESHVINPIFNKQLPYDSIKDFEPVGIVTESPRILLGRKDLPVKDLGEFVAYAKANQAKMTYGSAGIGSGTHLPCALFNHVVGLKIEHIPFRGAGQVLTDLIAGRIDYMCDTIQTGAARAKSGQVKGLAVMAPKRLAIIPDLGTTGEQGVAGVEATVWNAFFFPRATPKPIVAKMHGAIQTMLARPEISSKMESFGLDIVPPEQRSPEFLAKQLREDIERWGKLIRETGITVAE